ncbi:hypothetical protein BHE74_00049047 [Ensete ventricosum]|uniref:Uncharacterized protein n=1 Tax=Ensete ventricosum TaxID=4639 RepID=A0A426YW04_ENSVE|nr:hypothetical protein B296_00048154 [Ensete ventricosum]RWW45145.1 hypothetical protein BHE74_00049047 [Ensete ventricosum]RZS21989.1 hypothetical protein BHM03_00054704 [Ensete ventricosum]
MRFRSVFFRAASRAKLGAPAQQQRFRRTYSHLRRPDSERSLSSRVLLLPAYRFTLHSICPRFCFAVFRVRRPSFGIAFDIDGVILRGRTPIGGSPQALRRLYDADGIAIRVIVF